MNKLAFLIGLLFTVKTNAQNLVINPSFEITLPCNQINSPPSLTCYPWFMPTNGSTDYFNQNAVCMWDNYAPSNMFGYQYARTGIAYCGLGVWSRPIPTPNYREYLEGILIDTLIQGHSYCVSFYIVNANITKFHTSDIQLYFSNDSVEDYTTSSNLLLLPQIVNTNGIIYDTLNWVQVSGSYLAQGGEKYITIGNFKNDSATILDSNTYANDPEAYYYIDDVSVVDCTVGINEINKDKYHIKLMPNPAKNEVRYFAQLAKGETGKVSVYSQIGIKNNWHNLTQGINNITFDLKQLTPGIYVVETFINNKISNKQKLVVIK